MPERCLKDAQKMPKRRPKDAQKIPKRYPKDDLKMPKRLPKYVNWYFYKYYKQPVSYPAKFVL